jgi:hypothetical protein
MCDELDNYYLLDVNYITKVLIKKKVWKYFPFFKRKFWTNKNKVLKLNLINDFFFNLKQIASNDFFP